jgi:GTPase SAR1 family protein
VYRELLEAMEPSGKRPLFVQLVTGPPGSGKTTFCAAVSRVLLGIGRAHALVNLDPGVGSTEVLPYQPDIDIRELVVCENVMKRFQLGPNGALLYCMDYLWENIDWLEGALRDIYDGQGSDHGSDTARSTTPEMDAQPRREKDASANYVIVDMPGQVELFVHHNATRKVIHYLTMHDPKRRWSDLRAVVVNIVDAQTCTDPHKFMSASVISLMTMMNFGLPHVNVLMKSDLFQAEYERRLVELESETEMCARDGTLRDDAASGPEGDNLVPSQLLYQLDIYADSEDPLMFIAEGDDPGTKLSRAIAELLGDYGLVRFETASARDPYSILQVLEHIDRASGYCYIEQDMQNLLEMRQAVQQAKAPPKRPHSAGSSASPAD